MNLVIHFRLKSGKVNELESQKARESQGTLLKKLGGNPEEVSHNFAESAVVKACLKSKLTTLKNGRGGRGVGVQKSIYIQTPSVWSFPGINHTQE